DTVEGVEQGLDLGLSSVQFLWNQQPVRRVVFAQRELVDAMLGFPFIQTAPKIACSAGRCLVRPPGSLRKQLHDDSGHRTRNVLRPFVRRKWLSRNMGVNEFHWIGR